MASKRKRSDIWGHFNEVEPKRAKCGYCNAILSIASGNTSNLTRHMTRKHPAIPIILERQVEINNLRSNTEPSTSGEQQQSSQEISQQTSQQRSQQNISDYIIRKRPISAQRSQVIDKQVVKWISKGQHSLGIVEKPELKKILEMVSQTPGYSLPGRKTLSKGLIPKIYNETVELVKNKLTFAKAVFCNNGCT